jgi:hypothetical protein
MIAIAGGILLGFLGLGVLGIALSIDWRHPSPPPGPDMFGSWIMLMPSAIVVVFILVEASWRLGAWMWGWR